jgi:hypothetical protein
MPSQSFLALDLSATNSRRGIALFTPLKHTLNPDLLGRYKPLSECTDLARHHERWLAATDSLDL